MSRDLLDARTFPESDDGAAVSTPEPSTEREARLEHALRAPEPDTDFVNALGKQLHLAAAQAAVEREQAAARRRRFWSRRRLLVAGTSVSGLIALASIALSRQAHTPAVTAADVIRRAEQAATIPSSTTFKNYVVTEQAAVSSPDGGNGSEQVRSVIQRWYQGPDRWRREVSSEVIGADGARVSASGLTTVSDGATVWIHRQRDNVVMRRPYTRTPDSDELGPFPEVTGGLSSLLAQAETCYTPRITGKDAVAGRKTLVLDLGQSRCATGALPVAWTIWVDAETFLILRADQQVDGKVFATVAVTSISYNVPIDSSRFTFSPPPGAKPRTDIAPPALRAVTSR